jgi:hypothetical protein
MPTSEEIDRLFFEAADHARLAEAARQDAARHYKARRHAVQQLREADVSYGKIAERLGLSRAGIQSIVR